VHRQGTAALVGVAEGVADGAGFGRE
jgi:hypothetical protein